MTQALLHREQDIGIAARLDMDDAIGVQPNEMERWRKQIAPTQTPEYRPRQTRENAGKEDRRACIVGQLGTSGDLVQCAARQPTAWKPFVEHIDPEWQRCMARCGAFDLGDASAQLGEDGYVVHWIEQTQGRLIRSFFVLNAQSLSIGRPHREPLESQAARPESVPFTYENKFCRLAAAGWNAQ